MGLTPIGIDAGRISRGVDAASSAALPGSLQLSNAERAGLNRVLSDTADGVDPPRRSGVNDGPDLGELALDLTQIGLDIVGIFEPTPFADGANTLISIGRGDWFGAITSAAGIIPYVGDAAKLGKLGRWAQTVAKAVDAAASNPAARRALEPALRKIKDAIDAAPQGVLDSLPASAREAIGNMKSKLDDLFARGGDDAAQAAARRDVSVIKRHRHGNQQVDIDGNRWNVPPGKTANDVPLADPVGDKLQEYTTEAAGRWNPRRNLSAREREAIADAREAGEHWRANLLEKQAKGRWVENQVRQAAQRDGLEVTFSRTGLDVTDPSTGTKYDIMSGTQSNMDTHAMREPDELFRMITF